MDAVTVKVTVKKLSLSLAYESRPRTFRAMVILNPVYYTTTPKGYPKISSTADILIQGEALGGVMMNP